MRICVSCVLRLYVCLFFFFPLPHSWWSELHKEDDSVHFIRKTLPSDSECTLSSIAFFVNWDDVQLSEKVFFLCVFCFVSSSLSASLSPRVVLALHITPDTMGRACKIQRATLQTSWNLLCVYSNNFNPWLFTEQLQRCVWLWLKVFSVEKRTERSQIKSLCYCGFFFFLFWGVLFFFFLTSTL